MQKNPLFSTYRQGENRVTASMLAVFERIDLGLVERILATATGESSLQMVTFVNQPTGKAPTVPDARISANFSYWFELKTQQNALSIEQLRGHVEHLSRVGGEERLIVLTPDAVEPLAIEAVADPRLVWLNFRIVSDAISAVLDDDTALVNEQARFLLRELQALFVEERLIDVDDVVVVAARYAYDEYIKHGVYICQPNRSFRKGITHLAFYLKGEIRPEIARILADEDEVVFSEQEAATRLAKSDPLQQRIGEAMSATLKEGVRIEAGLYRVFVLSKPNALETVHLERPIVNTTIDKSGKPWAWTLSQRYTSLELLRQPNLVTTDQLVAPSGPHS